MAVEIVVPRLGWSMEQGTFVEWLKEPESEVKSGDMLYVIESEKASAEVESFDGGILCILPNCPVAGDTVQVGQLLGYLVERGESPPFELEGWVEPKLTKENRAQSEKTAVPVTASIPILKTQNGPTISPRARRVAKELGIDWRTLGGSGTSGRIQEKDIRAIASDAQQLKPISSMRRLIAGRLAESTQQTVSVTLTTKTDATRIVALRQKFKSTGEFSPTYNDMFIKLAADSLQVFPALHTQWKVGGLFVPDTAHIGLAVDAQVGLIVPVVQDALNKSLMDVARETAHLIALADEAKLESLHLAGATFTITNLGPFGVDSFTPVINLPQCAILGVGQIVSEPAVVNNEVVPRDMLTLCLTFDHRIVDGVPAARFLAHIRDGIESPREFLRIT